MRLFKSLFPVLLLIVAAVFFIANTPAMQKDYNKLWQRVDSLSALSQPRSALEVVEEIHRQAVAEKNTPQLLKASIYRIKLVADFEEDYFPKSIGQIEEQIQQSEPPATQVLHSVAGELYLKYFQANRYQILERSTTGGYSNDDLLTWDAARIHQQAANHFLKSLENKKELQKIEITNFAAILEREKQSEIFRPTLYDFLVWRALDFFSNNETDVKVAAQQLIPTEDKYYDRAADYIKIKLPEQYSQSNTAQVLELYQQLIAFHLDDKNPAALIDADVKRLEFVHSVSAAPATDSLYTEALHTLQTRFSTSPESTKVAFALAQFYYQQPTFILPLKDQATSPTNNRKAAEICREAIQAYPESIGAKNCKLLLTQITEPEVQLQTENAVLPGKPSLALLSYKNVASVQLKIVKMEYEEYDKLRNNDFAAKLAGRKAMMEWEVTTPGWQDYESHQTEIKIPALPKGFYLIIAETPKTESVAPKAVYSAIWATELSFVSRRLEAGGYDVFVLNRESGKPIPGVTVNTYTRVFDQSTRSYDLKLAKSLQSDRDGFLKLQPDAGFRGAVTLSLTQGDDRFVSSGSFYLTATRDRVEKPMMRTFFFTDRSIYRPGQTVYFKTIVLEKTGDKYAILPQQRLTVEFMDVNGQQIAQTQLTTNTFGSANGSFTIPAGVLNGQMRLKTESGNHYFNVEEYKRPNFEVAFLPVEGSYKLNQPVTISGKAQAYAGNSIDGATVKYRVTRNVFMPWRGYGSYGRFIWPRQQPVEIAAGEVTTQSDGTFEITFTALPGKQWDISYQYQIEADVTDITGETHSASQWVNVGEEALVVETEIPENVNQRKPADFKVLVKNLNGQPQAADVKVTIYNLKQPAGLVHQRQWDTPDHNTIPEQDFRKDFPSANYKDEDFSKWDRIGVVYETTFNTAKDSLIKLPGIEKWSQGKYLVVLDATDATGEKAKREDYFTLFDLMAKKPPINTYEWFEVLNKKGEPGENATFLLGSSAKDVQVLTEVQLQGKTIERKWMKINNAQQLIEIPIKEAYRGNFTFQYIYVIDNHLYQNSVVIEVPYTNKQLDVAFETMRSTLVPGSKEKWTVTIRNKNGDKVAAEMLASMYDASLDAFVPHQWSFDLYNPNNRMEAWGAADGFGIAQANQLYPGQGGSEGYYFQNYDRLNWFGFDTYNRGYDMMYSKGRATMANGGVKSEMVDAEESPADDKEQTIPMPPAPQAPSMDLQDVQLRRDFNETAFFYPQLKTNEQGDVVIEFTLPESFTRWKFQALAHTTDLMTGMLQQEFTAAKKLMVVANAPRFFRQGDTLYFAAKVTNLSDEKLAGQVSLEFTDALTEKNVTQELLLDASVQNFSVAANESRPLQWKMAVPKGLSMVNYRIKAAAGNYTDGEERPVPVVTNRKLVTEAMPMPVGGKQTRRFSFDHLAKADKSNTLENYQLTLEFSSNPAWYAVQALPVISEPAYDNAIAWFSAWFANSIAFDISNKNPEIKRVFEEWKNSSPEAFLSALEKNQQLKEVVLQQTPWVLQARNEKERKQRIALLFDINNMQYRLQNSIRKMQEFQKPEGGFGWMNSMRPSRYITQMIVQGAGKLDHLGIKDAIGDDNLRGMMNKAVRYLDGEMQNDFIKLKKQDKADLTANHLSSVIVQYLYARSFFNHIMINPSQEGARNYYLEQADKYWPEQNIYLQGMLAVALQRAGKEQAAQLIIKSLRDRALHSEEMGMYWRTEPGYYWYQAPVETQAMMIEAFDEVARDGAAVEKMKIWLLRQKQVQDWETSRATTEAIYALLGRSTNLLQSNALVNIEVGGKELSAKQMGKVEAGTGYFATTWNAEEITPALAQVTVAKPDEGIAWGAMYWQYFEDLDKITAAATPLQVEKELFVERDSPATGRVIVPVTDGEKLMVGDKLMVRIIMRTDRDLEYVHLRDMRAAAFEPINVLSHYKYSSGLGYYETTTDVAVDFFFDALPKGTYVFEYPLVATVRGDFSNGITTLQCMYAPEFSAHSEGIRVKVAER